MVITLNVEIKITSSLAGVPITPISKLELQGIILKEVLDFLIQTRQEDKGIQDRFIIAPGQGWIDLPNTLYHNGTHSEEGPIISVQPNQNIIGPECKIVQIYLVFAPGSKMPSMTLDIQNTER